MTTLPKKEISFLIERTDYFQEPSDISSIYDLTNIPKESLTYDEKEQLLYSIKKMILSTNLYSKWKSSAIKGLFILIHSSLFITGIITFIFKTKLFQDEKQFRVFIAKITLLNILILPFWVFSHFYVFKWNDIIHNMIYNLGKFILENDSISNETFDYELNKENLSIKVTKKNKHNSIRTLRYDNYIQYVININFDFEIDNLMYKNLIPQEDLTILVDVYTFINKQLKDRLEKFVHGCLIPSTIISIMYIALAKENKYFYMIGVFMIFLFLLVVFIIQKSWKRIFKRQFQNYIDDINNSIIKKLGKFVFVYKNMVMIFTLNYKGRKLTKEKIVRYINKILFC